MSRTPEDGGHNPRSPSRQAGPAILRLVTTPEADHDALGRLVPELPDLSVDAETANLMYRSRWCAVVRAYHPVSRGAALHAGFSEVLKERLRGRRPAPGFAPDFVEVNFRVSDGGPQSWADAVAVGEYLSAIVDPVERRPAEVILKLVNTSDLDPFLPEHLRTQR